MVDKNRYFKSIQDNVKAREDEIELGLSRLRSAQNLADYKTALRAVPSVREPQDAEKGMQLLVDKREDPQVRLLVLQKALSAIGKNADYIRDCLAIAQDPGEQIDLRRAILTVLASFSFGSRAFVALRPEYMALLRSLIDDPDPLLRESAAEELAKDKDEYVHRRLLDGLAGREQPIVSTAKAIQLLGYDIHAEHFPVARRILEDPLTDETTRVEAIHVLANDPESKDVLTALMTDKRQTLEVRMSSATALKTSHLEHFSDIAKSIVVDEQEPKDMRALCLNALVHHSDSEALHKDDEFLRKLRTLQSSTKSTDLKRLSAWFLDNAVIRKRKP
jgi:hypothetical protein